MVIFIASFSVDEREGPLVPVQSAPWGETQHYSHVTASVALIQLRLKSPADQTHHLKTLGELLKSQAQTNPLQQTNA